MSTNTNTSTPLNETIYLMRDSLKEIGKKVKTEEVKEIKELLNKYDIVLKDDSDENDAILQYETFYDQLNECVLNKRKEIEDIEKMVNTLSGHGKVDDYSIILNKKKENTNHIIDCNNRIVKRIRKLESVVYNNKMKELDNMKQQRYIVDMKQQKIKSRGIKIERTEIPTQQQTFSLTPKQSFFSTLRQSSSYTPKQSFFFTSKQSSSYTPKQYIPKQEEKKSFYMSDWTPRQVTYFNTQNHAQERKIVKKKMSIDKEMDIINKHMNTLKYWSKKSTSNVLFDSKVDGDGTNNELYDKVFNKSNLYFISFDENNNVYGGYINTKIDKSGNDTSNLRYYINDENAFVFSLIKDGEVNKKGIISKKVKKAHFLLFNYELDSWLDNANPDGALYRFGNDIISCDISDNYSWCTDGMDKYSYYYYYNDDNPFTDVTAPETFKVRRIIVLKMKIKPF